MKPYRLFDRKTVKENLHLLDKEIAPLIGRSAESVADLRRRVLGVTKEQHRFRDGHTPWNKGKSIAHSATFQKGHTPITKRKIGDVYTRSNYGVRRTYIITEDSRAYPYQKYLLEQHLGEKIPAGLMVIFLDKDPQNFDISNLKAVTKKESLLRNQNPAKGNRTKNKQKKQMLKALIGYGIKGENNI